MIITPTVGRIVWYTPHDHDGESYGSQPFAAIVTYVHHDRLINITYFDHAGTPNARTSVILIQEGDDKQPDGICEWMPYQIGQAKKHEAKT